MVDSGVHGAPHLTWWLLEYQCVKGAIERDLLLFLLIISSLYSNKGKVRKGAPCGTSEPAVFLSYISNT